MMFSEKDMEDAISQNPEQYLGETGLKLVSRQFRIGSYIFDLLFEDRHGAKFIVELQKGVLDRTHTYKILDYYHEFKENNPTEFIELMVIANRITRERKKRLSDWGVSFKEIPESEFSEIIEAHNEQIQPPKQGKETTIMSNEMSSGCETNGKFRKTEQLRIIFFEGLVQKTNSKTSLKFSAKSAERKRIDVNFTEGKNKFALSYVITENNSRVELYIRTPDKNKSLFNALYNYKDDIEKDFGFALDWSRNDEKESSQIRKWFDKGGFVDQVTWPERQDEMVDTMVKFEKVFRPRLKYIL